jgi:hypothetical protein
VDRRHHPAFRVHGAQLTAEDPRGCLCRRFHGPGSRRDLAGARRGGSGVWAGAHSVNPELSLRRGSWGNRSYHLPAGRRGEEGAGDGELRPWRPHRSRRDGRSVARFAPIPGPARGNQADQVQA